ncbi:15667_t:CDS:1, partial [Dentiscutata erythropus]
MNTSTNKEDFKDWGDFDRSIKYLDNKYLKEKKPPDLQEIRKKNYKMPEPVVLSVVPEEDDRLPYEKIEITEDRVTRIREWLIQKRDYRGKAETFDTIMDDF